MVRDPIERMRSAYIHALWDGTERLPISEALLQDPRYVAFSRYAMQLERYLQWFPESQILVSDAEDLRAHRTDTLARVFSFIGVDPSVAPEATKEHNTSEGKRALRASGRLIRRVSRSGIFPDRAARRIAKLRTHRLASRKIAHDETEIDDDARRRLIDLVRPDLEGLSRWMGPRYDGWGLLEPGPKASPV
jgi:hypothetical protein